MRGRMFPPARNAPVVWLLAGLACAAGGVALALSVSPEAGGALFVLGAGVLWAGAAALRRSASAAELDRLDVSPAERTWHALRRARDPAAGGQAPPRPADLDDDERRLGEMISGRCDRVWEGVRERRYVKSAGGRVVDLDGGAIFDEIRDIVQEVAGLYHAGSDNAVLKARTGDVALAVRSAIGDLLHLVNRIPYVDPAGWSVESVVTRLEQAEKGLAFYRRISPYERYVNAAWIAARFAAGASPISIAAWFLGTEGVKRIGGRFVKARAEAWIKELLEGSVGLVYLHVARTYDPQRVHRGAEWAALVEALRIHARIPGSDRNRKLLLDRILRARIPDEFAKMALLRALAGDREPDRGSAPPVDLAQLAAAQRDAAVERLRDLLSGMEGLDAAPARAAIGDLEGRLGTGLTGAAAPPRATPRRWRGRWRFRRRRDRRPTAG